MQPVLMIYERMQTALQCNDVRLMKVCIIKVFNVIWAQLRKWESLRGKQNLLDEYFFFIKLNREKNRLVSVVTKVSYNLVKDTGRY